MTVIARDAVASDHLVYAWPFPLGPDCEVKCGDDEEVVMCPAWLVGDRLGPGHHHYRSPDPMRPVSAFFVLTSPVDVAYDLTTMFLVPTTRQPVRLRASGSLQVRCADPGLLIAQFVGLPFDHVNDGILRSVSRSVERMLARLLTRRVVMAGTPLAVTDPQMLGSILEELVAYNPTAGAVFGVELMRMGHLTVAYDDGSTPYVALPSTSVPEAEPAPPPPAADASGGRKRDGALLQTIRGTKPADPPPKLPTAAQSEKAAAERSGPRPGSGDARIAQLESMIAATERAVTERSGPQFAEASGEIIVRSPRSAGVVDIPKSVPTSDETQPLRPMKSDPEPMESGARGSIMGIGMSAIGSPASPATSGAVSGEIAPKVAPGSRVLVPGPNGLMQSATVRQLLQGYYELEVGSSGETIWVPISGVVPE